MFDQIKIASEIMKITDEIPLTPKVLNIWDLGLRSLG